MLAQAGCTRAVRERRRNLHAPFTGPRTRTRARRRSFQRGGIAIAVTRLLRPRCEFCPPSFRGSAVIAGVTRTSEADTCVPPPSVVHDNAVSLTI